jgi:uncharacterized protein (DUF1697 family)
VAKDDLYPYCAAEGRQRRWHQFAPDEGFRAGIEDIGLGSVRTYIQTGNAVFHANQVSAIGLPEKIRVEIGPRHGSAPEVVVFGLDEMESAIASNPYPKAASDPQSVHSPP